MKPEEGRQLDSSKLTFKLAAFEGPLDLLLHLIKQNKMDIYDIPMVEITSQYIEYLHKMRVMSLDIAGEYLVMAATLINIKSKMLLPQHPVVVEPEQQEDPRAELVQQLLTHQCFQEVSKQLDELAQQRAKHYTRDQEEAPPGLQDHLGGHGDPVKMQQALLRLFSRHRLHKTVARRVGKERYTLREEITKLEGKLQKAKEPINFEQLFDEQAELEHVVTTFLALLELMKRGAATIVQTEVLGPIWVRGVA
ncbi:segregation and condensation protein A [Liquorilactobacillus sucicola DSM 21376 = JCM 15457]|uniref:Segregation and condensation protein A n=1 Tax=Liquorilactobacillus sucicola DSM 21376 = JCM 15457 TaxID=1423806 RepID=A0A0R2DXM9_9LACO|nr:segregation/condensation protein A [Liquorilactobacillus sucicola]KRN05436.1 segregation and condensation protein A [Liquorilactobacillus sucicola DSM 21376 = JCM 15457]